MGKINISQVLKRISGKAQIKTQAVCSGAFTLQHDIVLFLFLYTVLSFKILRFKKKTRNIKKSIQG
jgi:hypothetical protein